MGTTLSSCLKCVEGAGPKKRYHRVPPDEKEKQELPPPSLEDFVVRGENTEDAGWVIEERLQQAHPFQVGQTPAQTELNREARVRMAQETEQRQKESDMRRGEFSLIMTSMEGTRDVTVLGHLAERALNAAEGRSPPQPESAQRIGMVGRMLAGLEE